MADDDKTQWHLNAKVPLSIIAAILFQSACFIWYGAKLDAKVQQTSEQVVVLQNWRDKQDDERLKIEAHLAVIDERTKNQSESMKNQSEALQRIEDKLEHTQRR